MSRSLTTGNPAGIWGRITPGSGHRWRWTRRGSVSWRTGAATGCSCMNCGRGAAGTRSWGPMNTRCGASSSARTATAWCRRTRGANCGCGRCPRAGCCGRRRVRPSTSTASPRSIPAEVESDGDPAPPGRRVSGTWTAPRWRPSSAGRPRLMSRAGPRFIPTGPGWLSPVIPVWLLRGWIRLEAMCYRAIGRVPSSIWRFLRTGRRWLRAPATACGCGR
jgi:hypothetical protein